MNTLRSLASWVLALLLIAMLLHLNFHPLPNPPAGAVKLLDPPGQNIVFQTLADRTGIALFEPAGRVGVAFLELIAALLLLFPFSRRLGAGLAFLVLGGAVALHLSPWLGREVPTSMAAGAPGDGGQLFMLAVGMLVVSLMILLVHPGRERA